MPPNRLPIVDSDDGIWGDILRQYLMKEHVNDDTDNPLNGGHRRITIQAGTTGAGTAPIKLTSGSLMTSPEAGAIEFLTDTLYFTQNTGTTRKKIATYNDASGATGDIYYRDSSGYFTRLGIGSTGNILRVSGGLPNWFAPSYISATGMLEPVQAHTNGAENYTISAGTVTQIAGTSIHGGTYSPAVGDRILIATAPATSGTGTTNTLTTQPTNGIYTVTSNTTNLSVSRASDLSGSNHPAGLRVYSAAPAHSWRPNAVFTITTPQGPGSFTYGTNNIAFNTPRITGDSLSINTATNSINIWNGTGSTAIQPTASSGAQTLSLPSTATSDTLVGRASADTLTNKTLTTPVINGFSGTSTGNNAFSMTDTLTDTSGTIVAINAVANINPAATSTAHFRAFNMSATVGTSNSQTLTNIYGGWIEGRYQGTGSVNTIVGARTSVYLPAAAQDFGTITNSIGIQAQGVSEFASVPITAGTVSNAISIQAVGNTKASAGLTITNSIGVDVQAQTSASTSNIGVRIATAGTYTLQLSGTEGTAASGITFGTDTNLYRSTANTLRTDDNLIVGTVGTSTGSVATIDGTQTLTGKTISGSSNTITNLSASSITGGQIPRTAIGIQDFTNLAAGSDFEGATHPWNVGTNWSVQSDQAHSGTQSYRHTTGSGGSSSLQGTFQVQEGERIQIELWARRDAAYNGTDGNSKLRVANAADNSHLNSVTFGVSTVTVADTWTRRTGTITIPAGVTAATFTLQDDGTTGTVWIDDIVIRRMNPIWDSNFFLQDETDNTKQLQFQLSSITTATTRTLTVPDANTTIVGTDATQTLTNKTLTSAVLGGTTILPQTAAAELYNTSDQVTNYEKSVFRYTSNVLEMGHIYGGTGVSRAVRFGTGAAAGVLNRYIQIQGSTPFVSYQWSGTTLTGQAINIGSGNTFTASSGNQTALGIDPTINQTSTAGYTGLLINPTETGTGSGTKRLIDAQVGGAARFSVDNAGNTTVLGTLDLGNASDTTLSRSSAGVLAVEGVVVPTVSSVSTLTNKTLTSPRINSISDTNGLAAFGIAAVASAVNSIYVSNAATGGAPHFKAQGTDTNINIAISSKGTGAVRLQDGNFVTVLQAAGVTSAVNYFHVYNAITTAAPTIQAIGSDTNINVNLQPKGSGVATVNGIEVPTISSTSTLTNKTISGSDNTITDLSASSITSGVLPRTAIGIQDFTNLAAGSDFETGSHPWTLGTGWIIASDQFYTGAQSLKATSTSGTQSSQLQGLFEAKEGDKFYIEFWVRVDAANNGSDAKMRVAYPNGNGTHISSISYAASGLVDDTWTKRSDTITIPAGVNQFGVRLQTDQTAGNIWIDDIIIRRVHPYLDTNFTLQDNGDVTKQLQFQLSGITTATTRTLTVPDANTTVVGTDTSQTLTNKTINLASNTLSGTTAQFNTALSDGDFAVLDANSNFSADTFIQGTTSTVTAAGITTLTINSTQVQVFTGTTTQTVRLPTTSVAIGQSYTIVNNSTGAVAVQSSNGNAITSLAADTVGVFVSRVATPTSNTQWTGNVTGSGDVLTANNSLTLAGTDGTTMTFPSSSGNVVTEAAAQNLTNKTVSGAINSYGAIFSSSTLTQSDRVTLNFGTTPLVASTQFMDTGAQGSSFANVRFTATANGPYQILAKSRGATIGARAIVLPSDQLGSIAFDGDDGTDFVEGARIRAVVDGTPGTGDMPTRLEFLTTPDGANQATLALTIKADNSVIANSTISGTQLISSISTGTAPLTVASTTKVTNLNADLLDDMNATSALTGSTIMSRDSNGDTNVRYLMSTYVNMSHSAATRNSDTVFYSSTDAYIRKNTVTGFKTSLALNNVDNTSDATKNSAVATLTNKTISGSDNTLSNIPSSAVTGMAQLYQSVGNMIIDPSFENDASWANAWGVQSTDAARHGTKSRKLTSTGAGRTTDRIILTHDGTGNPITLPTAGDDMRYWVFAHLRKHAGNTGGGTVYVTARYIDTSGVEQELHSSAVTADSLPTTDWNRHWAHAELATDGREVFASIEIGNDVPSGDQFYIDQVAFKDVSAINLGSTTSQTLENKTISGDDNTLTDIYPESLNSVTDLMGSEMVLGGDFQVDAFWTNAFGVQSTDQSLISGGKSRMITSTGGGATVDRLALLHDGSGTNLGQWANQPRSHTWRVTIRKHAGNAGGGNILLRTRWTDYAGSSFTTTTTYAHTSISNSTFSILSTTHTTSTSYRYFYCYVEMDSIPSGDVFYVGSASLVDNSGSVTPSGTQTISNKTLSNYTEELYAIGTVTTTHTLDLTDGNVQTATLTASTACTFTMPTATAGKSLTLFLKQAAVTGNGSATFSGVRWNAAGAPTITAAAGKMDILSFAADGTNWYGSYTQGYTP